MSEPLIIGILGDAGAGKDTLARALTCVRPSGVVSMADPLRGATARRLMQASPNRPASYFRALTDDRTMKEIPHPEITLRRLGLREFEGHGLDEHLSPRDALRAVGKHARAADPDVFARAGVHSAQDMAALVGLVAIPDVRYANEAKRLTDIGGFLVRVSQRGVYPSNRVEEREARTIPVHYSFEWSDLDDMLEEACHVYRLAYRKAYP